MPGIVSDLSLHSSIIKEPKNTWVWYDIGSLNISEKITWKRNTITIPLGNEKITEIKI